MDKIIPESEENIIEETVVEDTVEVSDGAEAVAKESAVDAIIAEMAEAVVDEDDDAEPVSEELDASQSNAEDASAEETYTEDKPASEDTEHLPRVSVDHRFDDDDDAENEAKVEREKKRRRKKKAIVALSVIFIIIAIVAAAAFSMNFVFTPEKTADDFITAMDMADVEKLSTVAVIAGGEVVFTQENTAPMFALYEENSEFRDEINFCLTNDIAAIKRGEKPKNDGIVNIEYTDYVLFKIYRVSVARNKVSVYTNFNGAKVYANNMAQIAYAAKKYEYNTYGYTVSADYFDFVDSRAVFDAILPGVYTVRVEYLSSFGETFEKEEVFQFAGSDTEIRLNIDFVSLEINNATDYDVRIIMNDKEAQLLPAERDYKMFPLTTGNEITVLSKEEDDIDIKKTVIAGEEEKMELSFASLTVSNVANGAAVDYYINGKRQEPIPGGVDSFKIYPLSIGDKVEFFPTETKYQKIVMPLAFDITEEEGNFEIIFQLKSETYSDVDKLITNDITKSFEIINQHGTKEDLSEAVLKYRTLAEIIDYAYNEETQMYSTISSVEISVDLDENSSAFFTHDAVNMFVEATIKYKVGYHKEGEQPKEEELISKELTLSYTLEYGDNGWTFPEITGEH